MSVSSAFSKLSRQKRQRQASVDRLLGWLDLSTQALKEHFAGGLYDAKGAIKGGRIFCIDVDASVLSKKELEPVAKKIEALHDLCRTLDIHFEVAGFDLLPRSHTLILGSFSTGVGVSIGADSRQTYGHYSHPRCDKFYKGDNGFPHPRADAAKAPDIRQEMAGGLAEKISVKSPLRLKPPGSG